MTNSSSESSEQSSSSSSSSNEENLGREDERDDALETRKFTEQQRELLGLMKWNVDFEVYDMGEPSKNQSI